MKNILFGLMAITSISFVVAAKPDLSADVSNDPVGVVFQTG